MGVYSLKKGAEDKQAPHKQDEVYYVSAGRAVLEVDGTNFPVTAGSVVFVPASGPPSLSRHRGGPDHARLLCPRGERIGRSTQAPRPGDRR